MNRSFVYGIVVASTTWCFSLYLYWVLVHSTSEMQSSSVVVSNVMPPSVADSNHNRNQFRANLNQLSGPDDEKRAYADKQKSYLYQKYKKEKKFRKISQRLIDELQPVQIDAGKGETTLAIGTFGTQCVVPLFLFIYSFILFISVPDEFGMVRNAEEQYLRDIGYKRHAFNILVSNKIGLIRDIPDTRNKLYVFIYISIGMWLELSSK